MNKLISFLLIFCFVSIPLFAIDDNIYFTYRGKVLNKMTPVQFEEFIKNTDFAKQIKQIEGKKKVSIELKDDPWMLALNKTNVTTLKILWINDKNEIVKKIEATAKFTTNANESDYKWEILYNKTAIKGFPYSVLLNIVFFLIIVLK